MVIKKYKKNGATNPYTLDLNNQITKLSKLKQDYHDLYNWQKGILAPKIKKLKKDINKIEKKIYGYKEEYVEVEHALEIMKEI